MPPAPPGTYADPWPCRIKANFAPLSNLDKRLPVRKNEEGVIWDFDGSQCRVDIDRANPRRCGWVPVEAVEWGSVTRGTPIRIHNTLSMPPTMKVSVNPKESPLKSTLLGVLQALYGGSSKDIDLNYMLGEHKIHFSNANSANNVVNTIISGIPSSLSNSFQRGNFTIGDIRNSTLITTQTTGTVIYAQSYEMPGNEQDLLRIGSSTNPGQRLKAHESQTNKKNPTGMWFLSLAFEYGWNMLTVTGTFYKIAQRSNPNTRRMVILCNLPEGTKLLKTVESLMIGLMGSYHDTRTAPTRNEGDILEWAQVAKDARLMTGICDDVFKQTGWTAACPRLNLYGVNITTPFSENQEYGSSERTPWVRQDGPGFMTFRRSDSRIQRDNQEYKIIMGPMHDHLVYKVDVPHDLIQQQEDLKHLATVSIVVEIITDGRVHQRQFGRLPYIGPYSDWQECLGFAIRMEFMTHQGLKCHYLQKPKDSFKHGNVPTGYVEVSNFLAAFKGMVYPTTNEWRSNKAIRPYRVIKVSFDNLNRILKIEQRSETHHAPEPTKRTLAQMGQQLKALGMLVSGPKPDIPGNRQWALRTRCDHCITVGPFPGSTLDTNS